MYAIACVLLSDATWSPWRRQIAHAVYSLWLVLASVVFDVVLNCNVLGGAGFGVVGGGGRGVGNLKKRTTKMKMSGVFCKSQDPSHALENTSDINCK